MPARNTMPRPVTHCQRACSTACRSADAVLFGAMGWPDIRYPDGTEIIPQLDLRMALDLYAGVRPIRWFPGLPSVLADPRSRDVDFVLIREQTEGLFYARGRGRTVGDEEAFDMMRITRSGTARVSEFAFRLAEQRKARGKSARVTYIDKANVFTSMAFFRKIFDEVATKHPNIVADHAYVDAMALNLVKRPWSLDVLVTENMFGDILSDLGAGRGSRGRHGNGSVRRCWTSSCSLPARAWNRPGHC
jgi:3-isopropylmalate dehydrogenase